MERRGEGDKRGRRKVRESGRETESRAGRSGGKEDNRGDSRGRTGRVVMVKRGILIRCVTDPCGVQWTSLSSPQRGQRSGSDTSHHTNFKNKV